MIAISHRGSFKNTEKLLKQAVKVDYLRILNMYGQQGVSALASATPSDSGLTSSSWGYEIKTFRNSFVINWTNSHIVDGVPIAIILQYGHGTRNGGYVQGRDYINPTMKPIIDKMADEAWREVTRA